MQYAAEFQFLYGWIRTLNTFLLCKSQGAEPSFLRFFSLFFLFSLFFCLRDKKSTSAISCSSYIKQFLFTVPIKNRTLLLATRIEVLLHFAVPFKNSIRKLLTCSFPRARKEHATYYQSRTSVFTAKQIKFESFLTHFVRGSNSTNLRF